MTMAWIKGLLIEKCCEDGYVSLESAICGLLEVGSEFTNITYLCLLTK